MCNRQAVVELPLYVIPYVLIFFMWDMQYHCIGIGIQSERDHQILSCLRAYNQFFSGVKRPWPQQIWHGETQALARVQRGSMSGRKRSCKLYISKAPRSHFVLGYSNPTCSRYSLLSMALACMQVFDDEHCNLDMFTMNSFYFSKHCKFQIFHNLKSMQKLWTGGLMRD